MKRLIIGLISAVLMAAGLVGVSGSSASAVCPYTGCVKTSTAVTVPNSPVTKGGKAKICVSVKTAGNGAPKGRVGVSVKRTKGGYSFVNNKKYSGGQVCFKSTTLNRAGRYAVRASFFPGANTSFGPSKNSAAFRVVR